MTGVLKQVKDCIRECGYCQSKQEKGRGNAEDATKQAAVRQARRKTSVCASEEEDDEANNDLDSEQSSAVDKHELVFVSIVYHLCHWIKIGFLKFWI